MNDERFLKDWLHDTSESPSDPRAAADKVVATLPQVAQRSRWWPLVRQRRGTPADTDHDISGRTRSMFSPLTAVTGGALILAIGGLLLVASPAVEPAARPAADAALDVPPSLFQGEVLPTGPEAQLASAASGTREDGSSFDYGSGYEDSGFVTDDARISGSLDWIWNSESPPVPDGESEPGGGISTVLVRISNDEGSWSGATTWVNVDQLGVQSGTEILSGWLTGAGAYDGLMAYTAIDTDTWKLMGYITPSGPPPAPEGFPSDTAS